MNLQEQKNIYLNGRERMDSKLQNQLQSNNIELANNPAFPKTDSNGNPINFLELIAYKRFNEVVQKIKRYTNIQNATNLGEITSTLMRSVNNVTTAEKPNIPNLEKLSIKLVVEEMEIPEGAFNYDVKIVPVGSISGDGFQMEGQEQNEQEIQNQFGEQAQEENMTASELFEMEKHKRRFINMLIQGSSKKGHYMFELVRGKLNELNPELANEYGKMMSVNDMLYWILPDQTIKQMASEPSNMAGKEEIQDDEDSTTLKVRGINFPVLLHELIKAIMEVFGTQGLPDDPQSSQMIIDSVDSLENETMDLRFGVPVWDLFVSSYPNMVFEDGNKYLQHYLFSRFCALDVEEFFRVSKLIMSQDTRGTQYMEKMTNEIIKDLQRQDYQSQFGNDDEGYSFDDILGYAKGGGVRKMELYDAVLYKGKQYDISKKDGIVGLKDLSQGAWGSDYPFIPLYKIDINDVTDMYGNKVEISEIYEDGGAIGFNGLANKGGRIKEGDKFGNYIITKYSPITYDDLGSSNNGLVKLVNQEDFDTILIQYDNALRGGKWFVSKNGIRYEGKNPNEVIDKLNLNKMNKGGVAYVDLFEDYENIPANVQAILNDYELEDSDYNTLNDLQNELAEVGYTFEFGLDAEPFALRPIGVEVNELQGYEDYEKGNFKSGGEAEFDIYDYDKKMALINLDEIYEYAIKIDRMINEDADLEEWVKMKLTRIEQSISDVKHSLEGWEKYKNGGEIPKKQLLHIAKYSKELIKMIQGGSRLMSWQEDKLAISSASIDDIYHHLDYKMGNRAEDLDIENKDENFFRRGGRTPKKLIKVRARGGYSLEDFSPLFEYYDQVVSYKKVGKLELQQIVGKKDVENEFEFKTEKDRDYWYDILTNEQEKYFTIKNKKKYVKYILENHDPYRELIDDELQRTSRERFINKLDVDINDNYAGGGSIGDLPKNIEVDLYDNNEMWEFKKKKIKSLEEFAGLSSKRDTAWLNKNLVHTPKFNRNGSYTLETDDIDYIIDPKINSKNQIIGFEIYIIRRKYEELEYAYVLSKNLDYAIKKLKDMEQEYFDKYAGGGSVEIDAKKIGNDKRLKVKNWYIKNYPTDDLGKEINDNLSFWSFYTYLFQGYNVYSVLGVGDSIVRERVFQKLAEILEVQYDFIYKLWLKSSDNYAGGGEIEDWMQSALYQLQAEEDNDNLQISFVKNNEFTCQDDDANEYRVFKNEDIAEEMAVEEVREDIEYQPENFSRDFLMDFVDVDDFLVLDIENANYDYVKDIEDESNDKYANRLIAELVDNGLISENEALTTDPTELSDEFSQDYINLLTSEQISDDNGVEYFIDNFGEDEFFKIVIDNNLIDFENASQDAVNMDGIAHFLARYDGETIYLDNNVVAYRTN